MKIFLTRKFWLVYATIIFVATTTNAQQLGSSGLYKHGTNSSYTSGALLAPELTDSVTTGSSTKYYVVPDASANTNYTGILTGSLTSAFKWNTVPQTGSADTITTGNGINPITGYESFTNYRKITWKGTGTLNLGVKERNSSGCEGTETTIPIAVIDAPTLTYPSSGGIEDTCFKGTEGSLNIQVTKRFWVTFSSPVSGAKNIQIKVNITRGATTVASDLDVNFTQTSSTSGYFTIPNTTEFDNYGTYKITLKSVSDRISRKGDYWNTASGNTNFDYLVNPIPTTGSIYHIPNMQ